MPKHDPDHNRLWLYTALAVAAVLPLNDALHAATTGALYLALAFSHLPPPQ